MRLIGIDVGTTHCKAGLFGGDGTALGIATRPTPYRQCANGYSECDPEELWQAVLSAVRAVLSEDGRQSIAAIGIASMAETGLLLDIQSGKPYVLA